MNTTPTSDETPKEPQGPDGADPGARRPDGATQASPHLLGQLASPACAGPSSTLALCLVVTRRLTRSKNERRRWYAAMRRAMRAKRLAMAQKNGMCIVLAAGREMTPADRHAVIDWLVDQPECEAILTSGLLPLSSVLDDSAPVQVSAQARQEISPEDIADFQALMRHVAESALIERLHMPL